MEKSNLIFNSTGREFLSIKEVAQRLNLHEMTIYRLIKSRSLPAFKVGGQWRVRRQFLDEWLSSHTNA
jgi:excisionase family DNA binding protein